MSRHCSGRRPAGLTAGGARPGPGLRPHCAQHPLRVQPEFRTAPTRLAWDSSIKRRVGAPSPEDRTLCQPAQCPSAEPTDTHVQCIALHPAASGGPFPEPWPRGRLLRKEEHWLRGWAPVHLGYSHPSAASPWMCDEQRCVTCRRCLINESFNFCSLTLGSRGSEKRVWLPVLLKFPGTSCCQPTH